MTVCACVLLHTQSHCALACVCYTRTVHTCTGTCACENEKDADAINRAALRSVSCLLERPHSANANIATLRARTTCACTCTCACACACHCTCQVWENLEHPGIIQLYEVHPGTTCCIPRYCVTMSARGSVIRRPRALFWVDMARVCWRRASLASVYRLTFQHDFCRAYVATRRLLLQTGTSASFASTPHVATCWSTSAHMVRPRCHLAAAAGACLSVTPARFAETAATADCCLLRLHRGLCPYVLLEQRHTNVHFCALTVCTFGKSATV